VPWHNTFDTLQLFPYLLLKQASLQTISESSSVTLRKIYETMLKKFLMLCKFFFNIIHIISHCNASMID